MATLATRRAWRSAREPAMAESRLKTRLSPLPGAPDVEELSQEQWVSRREGFGKGLNTQSSNSQLTTTTGLAGVEGENTAERWHSVLPRFRALERGKTPTSCLWCIALLGEVTVQEELAELKVSNNGYCLAS